MGIVKRHLSRDIHSSSKVSGKNDWASKKASVTNNLWSEGSLAISTCTVAASYICAAMARDLRLLDEERRAEMRNA